MHPRSHHYLSPHHLTSDLFRLLRLSDLRHSIPIPIGTSLHSAFRLPAPTSCLPNEEMPQGQGRLISRQHSRFQLSSSPSTVIF